VNLEFSGEVIEWRGPAPYHYVRVPEPQAAEIEAVAPFVSYGWGCIPVKGRVGETEFTTSLFPKDGGYLVPLKDKVRKAEDIQLGEMVKIHLTLDA
jgi:hypothetical protein